MAIEPVRIVVENEGLGQTRPRKPAPAKVAAEAKEKPPAVVDEYARQLAGGAMTAAVLALVGLVLMFLMLTKLETDLQKLQFLIERLLR